jgi:hypothetical protein
MGDFNNDGHLDLVVGNASGTVSVLLGNGAGSFGAQQQTGAVFSSPTDIAVGDFNRDGKMDIAVTNVSGANRISVSFGNGDGTFVAPVDYSVPGRPTYVEIGDFNADGNLDLVAPLYNSQPTGTVSVLLGSANGSFTVQSPIITGTAPFGPLGVAVGDFNGDGAQDFAVANEGESNVSVFIGNGNGTFQGQQTYSTGSNPSYLAVADLDQDGKLDLVVSRNSGNSLSVLAGNGDGTFDAAVSYGAGLAAGRLVTGDLNGDGRTDVVVGDSGYNTAVSTLLNASPGGTQSSATANLTVQSGTSITGTTGNDTIVSSASNQTLTGDAGADNFVFMVGFGDDTITDFAVGTDQLSFDHNIFADVTALLAATTDSAGGALITHGADTVTLTSVTKAQLAAHTSDLHLI